MSSPAFSGSSPGWGGGSPLTEAQQAQVDFWLTTLSPAEKLGQLFMVYFEGSTLSAQLRQMINEWHVGGVILYHITGNIESPAQVAGLVQSIQAEARLPLWVSIDQEGGAVVRLREGVTVFPSQMAVAATGSLDFARQMAQGIGQELRAMGITMNFSPVLDVNSNPDNPIIGTRAFGSRPEQVAAFGLAMVEGYRQAGVVGTVKHFPGHGDTDIDSHLGLPTVLHPLDHLEQVELYPFREAIQAGCEAMMTAHVLVPALDPTRPATLSPVVMQTLLREKLGFGGVLITDSLTMGALDSHYRVAEAAEQALLAGADILLFGADVGHTPAEAGVAYHHLLSLVESGQISGQRLDQSLTRILSLKAAYGLLPSTPVPHPLDCLASPTQQNLARQIAQASITLVRDPQQKLPIQAEKSLLVIWPRSAGNLGSALQAHHPQAQTLPLALNPSQADILQVQQLAATVDQVVVGSLQVARYPQQRQMIQALPPDKLVVVALGSPYDLNGLPDIDTYLVGYGDGEATVAALAEVLMGKRAASGQLPIELEG
ncbi:MAG: beta-N-acetylhexosaminidase [Cyanobacteriota bacterium]|nr:beta-N-acetylhexosaminidase [Cyanobacteriota bacterium]